MVKMVIANKIARKKRMLTHLFKLPFDGMIKTK